MQNWVIFPVQYWFLGVCLFVFLELFLIDLKICELTTTLIQAHVNFYSRTVTGDWICRVKRMRTVYRHWQVAGYTLLQLPRESSLTRPCFCQCYSLVIGLNQCKEFISTNISFYVILSSGRLEKCNADSYFKQSQFLKPKAKRFFQQYVVCFFSIWTLHHCSNL